MRLIVLSLLLAGCGSELATRGRAALSSDATDAGAAPVETATGVVVAPVVQVPEDAGEAPDASPADAAPDAGPEGVTCTVTRRTYPCTAVVTEETDVHLWPVFVGFDPEGGIATDSQGLSDLYGGAPEGFAVFKATDTTHTLYVGYDAAKERIARSGESVTVHETGQRMGSGAPADCAVPLIGVVCSGSGETGR